MNARRITFTLMLVMSMVAAAMAGMLYAGRLESGRYQRGTGLRALGHRCSHPGRQQLFGLSIVIVSLFGSSLVGMIDNVLGLASLDVSSGRSW